MSKAKIIWIAESPLTPKTIEVRYHEPEYTDCMFFSGDQEAIAPYKKYVIIEIED